MTKNFTLFVLILLPVLLFCQDTELYYYGYFTDRKGKTQKSFPVFNKNSGAVAFIDKKGYAVIQAKDMDLMPVLKEIMFSAGKYGYGSTQATVLVLEALSEYYRLIEQNFDKEKQEFKLNGKSVPLEKLLDNSLDVTDMIQQGKNIFEAKSSSKRTLPYLLSLNYTTFDIPKNDGGLISISTALSTTTVKVNDAVRLKAEVRNKLFLELPMVTAKIGIPAGLSLQPQLLKDLQEKKMFSYYEIFDNYLVLYWEKMDAGETRTVNLDLKAEFPGTYSGKACTAYLYYTPENEN